MTEAVTVALITGGLSLLGVLISNRSATRHTEESIRTAQAVTDTKLESLTAEVREHNHFARWWRNRSRSSIIGSVTWKS